MIYEAVSLNRLENMGDSPLMMQLISSLASAFTLNMRDPLIEVHVTDHDKVVIKGANNIPILIGASWFFVDADVNVSTALDIDTGSVTNGENYYIYACDDNGILSFKISLNSTYPSGFTASSSRKIGGFHTLCANVGTISGHTLTGYLANDILPASIWDLRHRAANGNNEGLVYDARIHKWIMIYLASGTGASTASAYLGTISDNRDWMDFVDDGHAIGMRLPTDHEFQSLAAGSNEETNIVGDADPGTTGGHLDTASQRMISDIGCEDCAGVLYQWLETNAARLDDGTAGNWYNLAGAKGSFYTYGTNLFGNTQLLAGGHWYSGAFCGSRCRSAYYFRWATYSTIGARFLAEPLLGR